MAFPEPLERLVQSLERLPGIGPRSAERIALHVLRSSTDEVAELALALRDARMQTQRCTTCGNVTLDSPCAICADDTRDSTSVCVVEGPREVAKMESAGVHGGIYHVLLDGYAPREGAEPDPSALQTLRRRVDDGLVQEIILATAPDREGEGAAALVLEALQGTAVSVSRLARGVPAGARLEYLHSEILAEAYRGRRNDA
ncbi:MAG: recombination protein RecR [Planctomycetes bacterium]|nr:recombination protein RecR [Planctomycetota bacterium]MBT4028291.1 recombination protein RecR [Planctomycetota bacterium]MBT4560916.1 recombination protein RecR [Planctomycetota bacterium]MBT5100753.1 recombination protein RecR [Planctomycetota bacterium]MBT7012491.1 recombination protein RecR [Planctomycetota bacterium]